MIAQPTSNDTLVFCIDLCKTFSANARDEGQLQKQHSLELFVYQGHGNRGCFKDTVIIQRMIQSLCTVRLPVRESQKPHRQRLVSSDVQQDALGTAVAVCHNCKHPADIYRLIERSV